MWEKRELKKRERETRPNERQRRDRFSNNFEPIEFPYIATVPILHGGDPSSTASGDAASGPYASPSVPSMAAALQKQTAEEQAALEDKLAADLNVIMALECPNFLPHVIVCYVIYPFGSFGSADAGSTRFNAFVHAVLLRAWNGEFLYKRGYEEWVLCHFLEKSQNGRFLKMVQNEITQSKNFFKKLTRPKV